MFILQVKNRLLVPMAVRYAEAFVSVVLSIQFLLNGMNR